MLPHVLIHVANVVYLASYAVRNIKTLRWLTIIGCLLLIPYFWMWGIWEAVAWNAAFLFINIVRLRKKTREDQDPVSRSLVSVWLRKLVA